LKFKKTILENNRKEHENPSRKICEFETTVQQYVKRNMRRGMRGDR
jgi:hypothetical protein